MAVAAAAATVPVKAVVAAVVVAAAAAAAAGAAAAAAVAAAAGAVVRAVLTKQHTTACRLSRTLRTTFRQAQNSRAQGETRSNSSPPRPPVLGATLATQIRGKQSIKIYSTLKAFRAKGLAGIARVRVRGCASHRQRQRQRRKQRQRQRRRQRRQQQHKPRQQEQQCSSGNRR